jgi:NADH-quinone oxidoreductase subunit F
MTFITTDGGPVVRIGGVDPDGDVPASIDADEGRVVRVGSTGATAVEPLVSMTHDGRTAFYSRCSTERAADLVSRAAADPDGVAADADAVVDHDPSATTLPTPDLPGLGAGVRDVLGACGWRRPTNPTDHEAAGGFESPEPAAVLRVAERLRGRGWGDARHDEPLGDAWEAVRGATEDAAVVVNGHGTPTDALLLASAPFEVLDGATAAARAVDADRIVVYASAADDRAVDAVREAAAAYPTPPAPIDVATGPPERRAAEPTMALEAIEGNHRLEARLRPPGPERVGLHGRPTLVHTPRTLAHLAVALRTGDLPGTRLVSVTGDVDAPATVELPETATLADALDAVDVTGEFKAACVGGRFGGLTTDLDVGVEPAALSAADLGSEGVVGVLAADRCVVEFVGRRTRYAADENCGRCVPCREGTTQLAGLLRDVYDGTYAPDDVAELVRVMETSSICAFGVEAGRPARTAIDAFESEFEAHADGHCPAGSCPERVEVS